MAGDGVGARERARASGLLGEQALRRGDAGAAAAAFESALRETPDDVRALLGLSEALARLGGHRRPRALVRRAHEVVPDEAPLLYAVAMGLLRFNEYARLRQALTRPAFRDQAPPQALAEAATALLAAGDAEAAMSLVERALERDPSNAAALYFRGNLRLFGGDPEGARADYLACLASEPRMYQASWMLAGLRRATPADNRLRALLAEAEQATPWGHGERFVRYALFREAHDLGQHDLAWRNLERACAIGRRMGGFDRAAFGRLVDRLVATFDARRLARRSGVALAQTPVFIVGMFRSGTTLLERILAGHADVADGGETDAFAEEVRTCLDRGFEGAFHPCVLDHLDRIDLDALAAGYAGSAQWLAKGRRVFTEKLPSNFLNVGLIAMALPQARIIHMRRDPMDTCFANLSTLFSGPVRHADDQLDVAAWHAGQARLMAHWETLLPDRVLAIDYADMVADPEATARRVATFCGLRFEAGMLDVGRGGGNVATASTAQVRQGIQRGRSGAWRPYAAHLGPMRAALGLAGHQAGG